MSSNNIFFYKTYNNEYLNYLIIYIIELYNNNIDIDNTSTNEEGKSSYSFSWPDIDPSKVWDFILKLFIKTLIITHNTIIFILQEYFVTPYYFLKDSSGLKAVYDYYKKKIELHISYENKRVLTYKLISLNFRLNIVLWEYINASINFILFSYWFYFIFKLRSLFRDNKFHYKKENLPITYWFTYPEIVTKFTIKKFIYPFKIFIIVFFFTTSIFILFFGFYYIKLISFSLITFMGTFIYLVTYKIYLSSILMQDATFGILIAIYGQLYDKPEDKRTRITNTIFTNYIQQASIIVLTVPYFLVSFFFYHLLMYISYYFLCFGQEDKYLNLNYTIYDFYSTFKKQTYLFKKVGSIKPTDNQWGSIKVYRLNLDYVECFIKLFGNLFYTFILINLQIFILLVVIFYLIITIALIKAFNRKERINAITYKYLNRNGEFKTTSKESYIQWFKDKFKL